MDLNKKMGPLPVWAWGLILGIGGYIVFRRLGSSSTATTPTDSVLDPNAVDPNTGLTYGQEEDAALNANATGGGSLGGGGTTSDSGAQSTIPDSTAPDIIAAINGLTNALTGSQAGTGPLPAGAPTPPPVTPSNPPVVTPTAHASPVQTADQNNNGAILGQINGLLSQGFKKVAGTTQAGGLAQTGTYTYTPPKGASLHTGPTKYFVYGTQATGLHIRAAT